MSHLVPSLPAPPRVLSCQPGARHRCFVDDVLRGLGRQAGGESRSRPFSEALEGALRRQLGAQWVRVRAQFGNYSAANLAGLGDIPGHTEGDRLLYDGWRPALTPEWVVGLQASYTFLLSNWGSLTPYLQTTYAGAYYTSDINLAGVQQDGHSRTDVRFIWESPAESFQLQFYYLNAEDEAVLNWTQVYNPATRPGIATLQSNWANPNTYGFIFKYAF